jgi:hypothetical protein
LRGDRDRAIVFAAVDQNLGGHEVRRRIRLGLRPRFERVEDLGDRRVGLRLVRLQPLIERADFRTGRSGIHGVRRRVSLGRSQGHLRRRAGGIGGNRRLQLRYGLRA